MQLVHSTLGVVADNREVALEAAPLELLLRCWRLEATLDRRPRGEQHELDVLIDSAVVHQRLFQSINVPLLRDARAILLFGILDDGHWNLEPSIAHLLHRGIQVFVVCVSPGLDFARP